MNINTLELRSYLLKPGTLEHLIDYFEANLIVPQEDLGMSVLGQFRPIGDPNRFVWIRGFENMDTRLDSLRTFYEGPVWEKLGPVPNDMMLEWHDVHLLRPLTDIAGLTCGLTAGSVAVDLAAGALSAQTGLIAVDIYQAARGRRDELAARFASEIVPAYEHASIQVRGLFVAEMSPNEFTRLPVIQDADELVVITAYEGEDACREQRGRLASLVGQATGDLLSAAPESLLLAPTLRSALRWLPC
jgi:hypothetical protein